MTGRTYNPQTHLLEYADVGLMSLYIADCDALAEIADALGKRRMRRNCASGARIIGPSWGRCGMRRQGFFSTRICIQGNGTRGFRRPTFIPCWRMRRRRAQAKTMIEKHLLNPEEFWGEWVIPSIARNDPAFQRSGVLAGTNLGADELPGLSGAREL